MTFQPPPPPPGPPGGPPQGPAGGMPPPPPGPPPAVPPGQPMGQPPAGPPAGQWGPPPGQPARPGNAFDPKSVNSLDWGILGAGALAFIFSFVSYYTVSIKGFGGEGSENAWHGFFGWFAMLCAVVGSAAIALELFMPHVKLPFPNRLVALGAYALAALCVILALFIIPIDDGGFSEVETGHGFGYWISLIVILAGLVLSFMRFQQTGGKLPIGGAGGPRPGGPAGPPR
jgi:hypothetical protein